jgi:Protein of unknown function (DUF3147)
MRIHANPSALAATKWHEYAARFLFGGLITAIAGIIAKEFGPVIGGLFLAFPAIFPASATLIEKHEEEKKQREGFNGTKRAADAVSLDAAGAAIGSVGLAIFAMLVWLTIPNHSASLVLSIATVAWLAVSLLGWALRKQF